MDIRGPGIPGPCIFIECGIFAITLTFAASKQRCHSNTNRTNDTKILARSQEIEDNRIAVTNMDQK